MGGNEARNDTYLKRLSFVSNIEPVGRTDPLYWHQRVFVVLNEELL